MSMSKLIPDMAINHHDRFRQIMSNPLGLEPDFLGAEDPTEEFSHLQNLGVLLGGKRGGHLKYLV